MGLLAAQCNDWVAWEGLGSWLYAYLTPNLSPLLPPVHPLPSPNTKHPRSVTILYLNNSFPLFYLFIIVVFVVQILSYFHLLSPLEIALQFSECMYCISQQPCLLLVTDLSYRMI